MHSYKQMFELPSHFDMTILDKFLMFEVEQISNIVPKHFIHSLNLLYCDICYIFFFLQIATVTSLFLINVIAELILIF